MKTLYIECNMGAAGDMLCAALLELVPDRAAFLRKMNELGLDGVRVSAENSVKCGIKGTHISVTIKGEQEYEQENSLNHFHDHENSCVFEHLNEKHNAHVHTGMEEIKRKLSALPVSRHVKDNAAAVYNMIAEAESFVHDIPVSQIHFHEVGETDAVADIVGVCLLMEQLAVSRVLVSPVCVGGGTVRCAHGVLPVPAPATARILRDVPVYGGSIAGELCTPTGAALLTHFADSFGGMPPMRVEKIGYGMGSKDFEAANCVRVFLGESENGSGDETNGEIAELCCNVDDMTGEHIGFAVQTLLRYGARDVFTTAVQMKKDRPGVLITCLCDVGRADEFAAYMLRFTSTFGVRKSVRTRYTLNSDFVLHDTPLGTALEKTGEGYSVKKSKLEYDELVKLAEKNYCTVTEAERRVYEFLNLQSGGRCSDDDTAKE